MKEEKGSEKWTVSRAVEKEPVKDTEVGIAGEKGRKLDSEVSQKLSEESALICDDVKLKM